MPAALGLKLDITDATARDTLRGPGSSSTEQIPSASPILHSPLASSVDPYHHLERGASVAVTDETVELGNGRRRGDEPESHVVVVGGDVGAFATALALAKSEQIRITLVNVGAGSLNTRGNDADMRGCLLNAQTLSYLDELGRWREPGHHVSSWSTPFDPEGRLNRWKGKRSVNDVFSISERVQDEGICLEAYQIQRYSTGQVLTTQTYTILTGEDVSMFGIETNVLLNVLRDVCLSHPRIDVRPRGIVRSVLPGAVVPSNRNDPNKNHPARNGNNNGLNTQRANVGETVGPPKQDRGRRRKVRESFIQLDDNDYDYLSPLANTSIPYSGADASLNDLLRNLTSRSPEWTLFSAEDLPVEVPTKPDADLGKEPGMHRPAVVLTSGERIEADAIVGTEGPESKVLDSISGSSDGNGGEVVREDGAFRTTVSTSFLLEDRDLRSLTNKLVTWIGPGRFLTTYPVGYNTLSVSLIVNGGSRQDIIAIEEAEGEDIARQMKNEVVGWCPTVRKLMALVDSATFEPVFDHNPLEKWVSDSGRVALLGEAAHPLLPFSHQALSNTISDALTLGALFRKPFTGPSNVHPHFNVRSPLLVPRLLRAFSAIRRPQCVRTQLTLREGRDLLLLEDGEDQKRRDETLQESGLLSEEEKHAEWLYDPFTPVERWWESETTSLAM